MLRIRADLQAHWVEQDLARVHDFLARESDWAAGIPRETLERALANSICYGGYIDGTLIAFARVVTDQATFAYLADVFVEAPHRGRGHGRAIVTALMGDDRLQGLRRWHLVTRDQQPLYAGLGFTELPEPGRHMQRHDPDVYRRERAD
jgi:N-acetylglutamate synthase-like GNAT family acetyltransferase